MEPLSWTAVLNYAGRIAGWAVRGVTAIRMRVEARSVALAKAAQVWDPPDLELSSDGQWIVTIPYRGPPVRLARVAVRHPRGGTVATAIRPIPTGPVVAQTAFSPVLTTERTIGRPIVVLPGQRMVGHEPTTLHLLVMAPTRPWWSRQATTPLWLDLELRHTAVTRSGGVVREVVRTERVTLVARQPIDWAGRTN